MFAADYSQIELRVLAHIADDEKLIEAFKMIWIFIRKQRWMFSMSKEKK